MEVLEEMISVNLKSSFWGCKAAAKYMKGSGCIINISSIAGKRGSSNNSAYVASKFGVNGLTQSMAKELGSKGIRVNALCPVMIETDGLMNALKDDMSPAKKKSPQDFIEEFSLANSALKSLPTARDVGEFCVMLASEKSKSITGQCINIDSGVFPQ